MAKPAKIKLRSLARANLGFEWRRTLTAISVLTLSGVLIYLQMGIMLGGWQSLGAFTRELNADLVIRPIERPGRWNNRFVDEGAKDDVWLHPNVKQMEPVGMDFSRLRFRFNGERERIRIMTINTLPNSMTMPISFTKEAKTLLNIPGNILISRKYATKVGIQLGDQLKTDGMDITVAGIFAGKLKNQPGFSSAATLALAGDSGPKLDFTMMLLVKLKDQSQLKKTQGELSALLASRNLRAIPPTEMIRKTSLKELKDRPELRGFFFAAGLAIFVALAVVVQTLRAAILAQRTQFGCLRALGVSRWCISGIALEQAFWTGVLSTAIAFSATLVLQVMLSGKGVTLIITPTLVALVSIGTIVIAIFGGLISLTAVLGVKPADLLR